tara:strand:+ start:2432 stop:3046 length:615 start_codon:yes stop_codon:yes gene_type:complete
MSFKKDKYEIIKNCLSKELIELITGYTLLKRTVHKKFIDSRYIPPLSVDWGTREDPYVPDIYSCYGDIMTETILQILKPKIEKTIKENLFPVYSCYRIYEKNSVFPKFPNTKQFDISALLFVGGDKCPITLIRNGKNFIVNLNSGDLLIYDGINIIQQEKKFQGNNYIQVIFNYTTNKNLLWDGRPHPGLPEWFSKNFKWLHRA